MRLSLLEAKAEKEKINLKTGSKLTKLLFQYISHTQRLSIGRWTSILNQLKRLIKAELGKC